MFCQVKGKEFDSLPELLFLKTRDRVAAYIEDASQDLAKKTAAILEYRTSLEKSSEELQNRLQADIAYHTLGKSLKAPQ